MAENHYVDPKDQHIAAEGVSDHSDLTVFYANKKNETLGPWMQEADRQAALQADRDAVVRRLRKSAFLIGLYTSLPVVIGIVLVQFFMTHVSLENAIPIIFLIIFGFGGYFVLTYVLFKRVGNTFHDHNLRALPITLTTLASLSFLIRPLFYLADLHIGGLVGYGAALVALVVVGIVISVISIFIWTAIKLPAIIKVTVLLLFFGASVAIAYLI